VKARKAGHENTEFSRHCHKNFNFAAQAISPKSRENKFHDPFMATGVYVTGKTLAKPNMRNISF